MKKKFLIIIDGLNGAGKSTVAKILHSKLPRTALLSYDRIKRLISDFTPNDEYHALANLVVKAMAKEYLDHDVDVVIESYIPNEDIARRYTELARQKGVELRYFQLEAPVDVRAARIKQRPLAEGAKKKLTLERLKINDAIYFEQKFKNAKVIETHHLTPEAVVKRILKELSRNSA
jgi:predicted kinase